MDCGLIHWHDTLARHVLRQVVCNRDSLDDYFERFAMLEEREEGPRPYPCTCPYRFWTRQCDPLSTLPSHHGVRSCVSSSLEFLLGRFLIGQKSRCLSMVLYFQCILGLHRPLLLRWRSRWNISLSIDYTALQDYLTLKLGATKQEATAPSKRNKMLTLAPTSG